MSPGHPERFRGAGAICTRLILLRFIGYMAAQVKVQVSPGWKVPSACWRLMVQVMVALAGHCMMPKLPKTMMPPPGATICCCGMPLSVMSN